MDLKQKPSLAFANRWSGSSLTCNQWSKTHASFAALQQDVDYTQTMSIRSGQAWVSFCRGIRRRAPAN
jgi:hypothetical protein